MIDPREHIYHDDPADGHPDVRTELNGVNYFFTGNGHILAALQVASGGEGTPAGLIIMDPDRPAMKRQALTFDPGGGFGGTMLSLALAGRVLVPSGWCAGRIMEGPLPVIHLTWQAGLLTVTERLFCPDSGSPVLVRDIVISGMEPRGALSLCTAVPGTEIASDLTASEDGTVRLALAYTLTPEIGVALRTVPAAPDSSTAAAFWRRRTEISTGSSMLNRLFRDSTVNLASVVSAAGVVDASIWQYCREWVRDHSFMAVGLTLAGFHEKARVLLARLLHEFVSDEGDCVDSSERRGSDEVELDQNGALLYALHTHACWSGDYSLIRDDWETIKKVADYPFRKEFIHPESGLLCNTRDYWERHALHGIERGIELSYQFWPCLGLLRAAAFARFLGEDTTARRWQDRAGRLRSAILEHPRYAMHDRRGFIKRRAPDGSVQETIFPSPAAGLPPGVPLAADIDHSLNPDTASVFPIALGFVDPGSLPARRTMEQMELLWNQMWTRGGHGRYNQTSEPDSAGPWPFASLMVARAAAECGDLDNVLRTLRWLDGLPEAASGSWFEMYGSRIAPPYPQNGIIPWTWAELIMLFVFHLLGVRCSGDGISVRPRLLPDTGPWRAALRVRSAVLHIDLIPETGRTSFDLRTDMTVVSRQRDELLFAWPKRDSRLTLFLPAGGTAKK
ncbi:hypothetical protein JXO52_15560 [bacterium]|nr:hypothetical protein [bacterium]